MIATPRSRSAWWKRNPELQRARSSPARRRGGDIVFRCGPRPVIVMVSSEISDPAGHRHRRGRLLPVAGAAPHAHSALCEGLKPLPGSRCKNLTLASGRVTDGGLCRSGGRGRSFHDGGSVRVETPFYATSRRCPAPRRSHRRFGRHGHRRSQFEGNAASSGGAVGSTRAAWVVELLV